MHSNSAESSFWLTLILAYSSLKLAIAAPAELNSTESWNPERRFFGELACDTADFFGIGSDNVEAYSPVKVKCPKEYTWIRPADSLSADEQDYLKRRRPRLEESWAQRMKAVGLKDLPRTPVVALALSGGGYRAMVSGSGMAFQQNNSAESVGDLVGISTYVSGLSGGSWALSSFYANNGMQPSDLAKNVSILDGSSESPLTYPASARQVWNLQSNLGFPSKDPIKFYTDLLCAVKNKNGKEFATQITDYWGLALSDHCECHTGPLESVQRSIRLVSAVFPKEYHNDAKPNLRWSDIPKISSRVRDADLPWPIIVAVEREEGEMIVGDNSTTYEFNLAEFGAWTWGSEKRSQGAFTPVRSIGTTLDNGWPRDMSKCYENFDNAG
jgi:lysophospholipase